jgi:hypothetical protein
MTAERVANGLPVTRSAAMAPVLTLCVDVRHIFTAVIRIQYNQSITPEKAKH